MDLLETYKKSIDLVKNHIIDSLLYGILFYILWKLLFLLPIIGAFIFSYFYPRLTKWYYTKVTGENINPDYKTAFKSLLIPNLLASIGMVILLYSIYYTPVPIEYMNLFGSTGYQYYGSYNVSLIIIGWAIAMISIILSILLLYTFYGSILGKVNKLSIYFEKSLILFVYILLYSIIVLLALFTIYIIYGLVISINYEALVFIILLIIFLVPTVTLVALLKAQEL